MPKILIKEFDKTSAGTPGRYGNYSVLLAGYSGTPDVTKGNVVQPDTNDVYEFSSAGDFLATIGKAAIEKTNAAGEATELHYGNRMAYHLLNLGYTVIYKVIDSIQTMNSETFWSIFKDKASYDFRFVSHGLLETCYDVEKHTELYDRLAEIQADVARFAKIKADVKDVLKETDGWAAKTEEQKATALEEAYAKEYLRVTAEKDAEAEDEEYDGKGEGYLGFRNSADAVYSYSIAKSLFETPAEEDAKAPAEVTQEELIADHDAKHVTPETFNAINGLIAKLASYRTKEDDGTVIRDGRGDCIALIELDEDAYCETTSNNRPEELIINGISNMSSLIGDDGKYCAMTVPSVYCKTGGTDPEKFPGAFYYLACFMSSLSSGYAEWYAAAGYTRGVSSYAIDHTSVKLGEIAINALEPRSGNKDMFACNVIANFRGSYYLWGNRTAAPLGEDLTADHFLNIRQLCTTIKKQLYVACRRFTFDPNSDTLWFNFVNSITPTLDAMKADQGIRDYKVLKVYTDKKATMKAKIRIIPIEAVEDFDLEISLEDSFGETTAVVNG